MFAGEHQFNERIQSTINCHAGVIEQELLYQVTEKRSEGTCYDFVKLFREENNS